MIVIDYEYSGKEELIKSLLISIIRKVYPEFNPIILIFDRISKKSNAHTVAIDVYRKDRKPNYILSLKDIEEFL